MYGSINTSSAEQRVVCGVDDRVNFKFGDISADETDAIIEGLGGLWRGFRVDFYGWDELLEAIEEGDRGDLCGWDDRHDSFNTEHAVIVAVGTMVSRSEGFNTLCDLRPNDRMAMAG
jgi:hypothetical protein